MREKIIFIDKQTSFTGNKFTLHKAEIDITWVRESYAFMELSWKGHTVKRFSTHSDFYGFLTSAMTQIDNAPEIAESWDILASSELELHVVGYLRDAPSLGFAQEEYSRKYYTPAKRNGDELWYDDESVKDGASFNFKEFPMEVRRILRTVDHSPTIVWNSAWDQGTNVDALLRYRAIATATEQVIGETDYRFHD
ncbi:hypothetical protein [Rhizobium sp. MHM7A]|uniref:hypothetical protein n=1 Tax=Rhizobium sp. MHM7A TaxID=2583233 RepID=UPI001106E63D|nr:hypothetical protein [Rhizobium sp. MHM7A]TLX17227.1 hypothetical protein FFR93_07990 [Rhizobium sp. MHM7A]